MLKRIVNWFRRVIDQDFKFEDEIKKKGSARSKLSMDVYWRGMQRGDVCEVAFKTFNLRVYEDADGSRRVLFNGMSKETATTFKVDPVKHSTFKINIKEALYSICKTLGRLYHGHREVGRMYNCTPSYGYEISRQRIESYLKDYPDGVRVSDLELYVIYNPLRILERLDETKYVTSAEEVLESEVKLMVKVNDFYISLENCEIDIWATD